MASRRANKRVVYWDTCIFIAHLTGEPMPQGIREGIDEVVREVEQQRSILTTSTITLTELLEGKYTSEQWGRLNTLFDRPDCILIALDVRIAKLAGQIRSHYASLEEPIKIKTPDAIHLASAIAWNVNAMYTTDGNGETSKRSSLLRFNGNVMNLPLSITVPFCAQPSLLNETTESAE